MTRQVRSDIPPVPQPLSFSTGLIKPMDCITSRYTVINFTGIVYVVQRENSNVPYLQKRASIAIYVVDELVGRVTTHH